MKWIPLLPLLVCFCVLILIGLTWYHKKLQRFFHLFGAFILLITTFYVFDIVLKNKMLVAQLGGYPAPFGITFVIDLFSGLMLMTTGIIAFCVSIYAINDIDSHHQGLGFYPAFWTLLMGICGAFSTGDLFNLYVWFEVMLISSFVLLVLGNTKEQLDGAMKYVSLNLVATILMLLAIALLYGITGTLNMADLSVKLNTYPLTGTVTVAVLLLAFAFSIKSALFPLFFWLPASYHTTNTASSAIFAGMLTKVGVYALVRVCTLILPNSHVLLGLLLFSSAMTMLTGVFGAVSQFHFRRLLSFHIISQIGYIVMGLAIYTPLALSGALFFMIHNIFAKTNLFLVSGVCTRLEKTNDIRKLGGFYQQFPSLAFLFFISAFSLAGIPPLSGFWGKLILLKSALITQHYFMVAILLLVSLLTLYSMTKIWNQVFWKEKPDSSDSLKINLSLKKKVIYLLPITLLVIATLLMSFFPQYVFSIILQTSDQLFHPDRYIYAVLGGVNV
ncbi:MAG: proton-conducting transporter membrane subunit [Coxiellaceae bacterium]|nr:proton-conducting transporter membrane subunit [Coxiellaceae bacterium]